MNTKSTDTNKLPVEVLSAMFDAFAWSQTPDAADPMIDAMQAAYDASPGPALEAENARLREAGEALLGAHLKRWPNPEDDPLYEAASALRTAIARAKGGG